MNKTFVPPWIDNPYALVNWWDMEKFSAEKFVNVGSGLTSVAYLSARTPSSARLLRALKTQIEGLQLECQELGLRVSALQCETVADSFGKFSDDDESADLVKPLQISQSLTSLQNVISNEMQTHLFLHILSSKQDYYEQDRLFGEGFYAAFPSAAEDVKESGSCYAADRNTACVMHLMRVLEVGLNVLAAKLGVSFDRRNWENVINDCESEIKKITGPSWGADWKQKLEFYSGAAKDFRYFKDAWRNHAMHYRERYDANEARTILEHVKSFMNHLVDGGLKE